MSWEHQGPVHPCLKCDCIEFVSDTGWELVAELLADVEAARAEISRLRNYRSLPLDMVWRDYYSPDEVIKIRRPLDDEIERLRAEVERLRANQRVEQLEPWLGKCKGGQ